MTLFRLIAPAWSWSSAEPFKSGKEDSIYGRLLNRNMDGKKSFMPTDAGMETLVTGNSKALITADPVHNYEAYHCKESKFYRKSINLMSA